MDKETLLTGLKKVLGEPQANGYIGDTGVTMRTLDKYAEAILPTITADDMATEQFYRDQAAVVKAMGGQMRFEQADFVKNYKPQPGEPPAAPEPNPGGNGNEDLLKRLEKLEKEREDDRKNSAVKEMRSEVLRKSGDLKVSNKNLWDDAVRMVRYVDGMDVQAMEAKAKELYESKLKSYFGDGASPYGTGKPNGMPPADDKFLDDFFSRKAEEGKFPGEN